MSLEEKLREATRQVIIEHVRNSAKTFRQILEDELGTEECEIFLDCTPADFGMVSPKSRKKKSPRNKPKTKTGPPKSRKKKSPRNKPKTKTGYRADGTSLSGRKSAAQRNSDFMRWVNSQENGTSFTIAQVCEGTGLSAPQVKKAIAEVGMLERHGTGRNTQYVVVQTAAPDFNGEIEDPQGEHTPAVMEGAA